MKRNKLFLFILNIVLVGSGLFFSLNKKVSSCLYAEEQVQTINDITAIYRVVGNNNKTFIRFACNDICGSYQTYYSGKAYTLSGEELPLKLYQNGGAGNNAWVNGGTRLFELKTDDSDFINALKEESSFIIKKGDKFTNGDTSITFAKSYQFDHIYDGSISFNKVSSSNTSFIVKEVETRLSTTKFRIGVSDFINLSAGFNDAFKGQARDLDDNYVGCTITDYKNGSTLSGNRRLLITLDNEVKNNAFYIDEGSEFANELETKILSFNCTYYIEDTNLSFCDGADNHIYLNDSKICEVCHYEKKEEISYVVTLGSKDRYCQVTTGTNAEIGIKIGGSSGYDANSISSVYRGTCLLNDEQVNLKVTINNDIVRFYVYLENGHEAVNEGILSINDSDKFISDSNKDDSIQFDKSLKIKYDCNLHKVRVDLLDYSYLSSTITNLVKKNWVSYSDNAVIISYVDVSLSDLATSLDEVLSYRGTCLVDNEIKNINITLQKVDGVNKLAFIFEGKEEGTLKITKGSNFALDTIGYYFNEKTDVIADILTFDEDVILNYDASNNTVNATKCTLSLSGSGSWSQNLDAVDYNVMCSFSDCSIKGISEDNSDVNSDTLEHRGYHFYGKGYSKDNESEEVDVDIWVSAFTNTDDELNLANVKTAIYANINGETNKTGIKLHKDDLFISSAYNLTLKLDDDYLVKWYTNSSRTTAGKYNNDTVGPTIFYDENNIQNYVEGEAKPTLPVAINDDVDDVVASRNQIWQEGALDENNCLKAGTWKVTLTATDSSGNEADPITIYITVNSKVNVPSEEEKSSNGCGGSIVLSSSLVSAIAIFGLLILIKRKIKKI